MFSLAGVVTRRGLVGLLVRLYSLAMNIAVKKFVMMVHVHPVHERVVRNAYVELPLKRDHVIQSNFSAIRLLFVHPFASFLFHTRF